MSHIPFVVIKSQDFCDIFYKAHTENTNKIILRCMYNDFSIPK